MYTIYMNILCSIDSRFIMPFKTLVWSLSDTQKRHLDIYLLHISLDFSEVDHLIRFCDALDVSLHTIRVKEELSSTLKRLRSTPERMTQGGFPSLEPYLRLFAPDSLPLDIQRCIYMDADAIVQKDLGDLYDFNLGDSLMAAVIDPVVYHPGLSSLKESFFRKCGLDDDFKYVNSGILLMNLTAMRKSPLLEKGNLIEYMESHTEYNDQDIVNTLLYPEVVVLSSISYNLPPFMELEKIENSHIIHYMSGKPWKTVNDPIPLQAAEKWMRCHRWVSRVNRMLNLRDME